MLQPLIQILGPVVPGQNPVKMFLQKAVEGGIK